MLKPRHGLSCERLYGVWANMKARCYNPKSDFYYRYGGRGIAVCDEWKNDPASFIEWSKGQPGYNDSLTIDRIDNDGNYEPSNCRWTTLKGQWENRVCYQTEKTNCPRGHEYAGDNVAWYRDKDGYAERYCRACKREINRATRARDRAARNNRKTRLSEDEVRAIRRQLAAATSSQHVIGRLFGVDASTIARIARGVTWKHVP